MELSGKGNASCRTNFMLYTSLRHHVLSNPRYICLNSRICVLDKHYITHRYFVGWNIFFLKITWPTISISLLTINYLFAVLIYSQVSLVYYTNRIRITMNTSSNKIPYYYLLQLIFTVVYKILYRNPRLLINFECTSQLLGLKMYETWRKPVGQWDDYLE